jgi:MoCo/4Fe-4S cofactor protein with predicted Tat translocation signal
MMALKGVVATGDVERSAQLAAIKARLAQAQGKTYWRTIEELAGSEDFRAVVRQEFPRQAEVWGRSMSRRRFLQLVAASLALAGLGGCAARRPEETIVPFVHQPEGFIAGRPMYYASANLHDGYAIGTLIETHEGRPTKLEGNPNHPASLGATDAFTQATILEMYDPDRSQTMLRQGQPSTWDQFTADLANRLNGLPAGGLRILTGAITSPTFSQQMADLLGRVPGARWHRHEPAGDDNAREGARLALGAPVDTYYDLSRADVIVSLDADFLFDAPGSLRYARQFTDRRRVRADQTAMNRLYVIESTSTITGSMADHRWAEQAGFIETLARALAVAVGVADVQAPSDVGAWSGRIAALAADLQAHRGTSAVIPGRGQPPAVHALAHAMNAALGGTGATVFHTDPIDASVAMAAGTLQDLVNDMNAGAVQLLVILDSNPVYSAPADLGFAEALKRVPTVVHHGLYVDETARVSQWHIPAAHLLETWSDARAFDGTATIIQPAIAPLYSGKSIHEVLSALLGAPGTPGHDIVKAYWQGQAGAAVGAAGGGGNADLFWQTSLRDGVVQKTAAATASVTVASASAWPGEPYARQGLEVIFRPDPSVWDGRYANIGWLQELPKPLTKIVWENTAHVGPATAAQLGLTNGDVVQLSVGGRSVNAPAWIVPGHAENSVTVFLGYGRKSAGRVGNGAGYNAYSLRTAAAPWFAPGLTLTKTGGRAKVASTQLHFNMEGRGLVQAATIDEFSQNPQIIQERAEHAEGSLYPGFEYKGHAWGMSVDMNACIGCNACVLACVAENNIPVVGKDQVLNQREMHWLRIDTYFEGDPQEPGTYFQPVMCMHCETAPCELVCPVEATAHSSEGLNDMVYNRCVGTRYCSNNCPYKVRRFNFLQYNDYEDESLKAMRNPDVTVRMRGVMEKCTYCVQRIEETRSNAIREGRPIGDNEIKTACQQACPTHAIVFGDINNPNDEVTGLKGQPQNYSLLAHLNTQPRTTYLARFTNPNPDIKGANT